MGEKKLKEQGQKSDLIAQKHNLPKMMTLAEVCEYARCSPRYLHEEIKRKNLKSYKVVRDLMFYPSDIEAWIKRKIKTA